MEKSKNIISIVSGKGGVGKTASSVNIAACLAEFGYKVLIIDLDKQANTTAYLNRYNPEDLSVADIIINKETPEKVIKNTDVKNLDIIPAAYDPLEDAPEKILLDIKRSRENRLKCIKELDYNFVIIDCPPDLGMLTLNALVISDYVLVPVNVDRFGLEGFKKITDKMALVRDEYNSKLKLLGAFITLDENTKINNKIREDLKNKLKGKFFKTTIRKSVKFVESTFHCVPVVTLFPKENISKDYKMLTKEVIANV